MERHPLKVHVNLRGKATRAISPSVMRRLQRLVSRAAQAARAQGQLSLSLSDDKELLALNRRFASEDHATDVLSFEQDAPGMLGDVIISVETARRQANQAGAALDGELFHLAVHGLVHLLGYDHASARDEKIMFGFEERLRTSALAGGAVRKVSRPGLKATTARRRRTA